ncbi:MAG TPA: ABC transporter permease [Candidatus Limnocylindrales bacterium]|nr:ABC transporter permease [Candidatus Limnocylindrales bacterium]
MTSVAAGRGGRMARSAVRAARTLPIIPVAVLATMALGAIFANQVAPHPPLEMDLSNALAPPFYHEGGSWTYPLGTDRLGRDIFSRLIHGGQVSLFLAFSVIVIGGSIGTALGLTSGYVGGRVDAVIQRGVEAILSLPTIMVALVFVFVLGQSFSSIVMILSPFIAASFARMIRGEALSLREKDYVALAHVAGASHVRIILRHILPNVAGTIIVIATLEVGALILVEASLSFLGVGVPPPTPAWGLMIDDGRQYLTTKYWLSVFPGLAIVVTVLSINWIGDWLRNALDPKRQII